MKRLVKIMVATIGVSALTPSFAQTPDVNANDVKFLCHKIHSLTCEAYIAGFDDGMTIGLQTDLGKSNLSYASIIRLLKEHVNKHPNDGHIQSWIILMGILFDHKELKMRGD